MHRTRFTLRALAAAGLAALATLAAAPPAAHAITTGHTGSGRPALALASSRTYVAWAGSSGTTGKQLVLGWTTDNGRTITKDNSVVERVPQGEGPALDADGVPGYSFGVYLAWSAANNGNTLTVAYAFGNGLRCRTAFAGVRTLRSPALIHDTFDNRWVAWTGTDNRINLARVDSGGCGSTGTPGAMVLRDRVTLAETTAEGPALLYDISGAGNGIVLGWTDAAGVIQLGTFTGGSATLTNRSSVGPPGELSAGGFSLTSHVADNYVWFHSPGGRLHRGFSQGCRPTCFYAFDYGTDAASGVGSTTDGFHDTYAYFDAKGKLNIAQE